MHRIIITFVVAILSLSATAQNNEVKVLSLNIWQEGTQVDGGYDAIVKEVVRLNPDFVTFSEVRNYHDTSFSKRIVESLAAKGLRYYSFYSYDSGLLSKYPITDSTTIFPEKDDHGSIYKLKTKISEREFAVYVAHLDYKSCAYYDTKGYDGNAWHKLRKPLTNVKKINKKNIKSKRDDAIKAFIADANKEYEKGTTVILGGDFNEPSLLDWTDETKNLYQHNGLVVNWEVSKLLLANGYKDAYREKYSSAVTHPGFTYPSYNEDVKISKLTWAPKSDERERIDFIYFKSKSKFQVKDIKIHGPKSSVRINKKYIEKGEDKFIEPIKVWPTDHKGVFAIFEM
jgi:endonuclease/exonuclease/phosphatase family metal-dependent hydrolase